MGLLSAISDGIDGYLSRSAPKPPGYFGAQTSFIAGPMWLDAFQSKRAPSGFELVEQYKSLIFACVQLNALGTARVPLRLMVDSTKGGKPKDVSGPRSIKRGYYDHLVRSGYLQRSSASSEDVEEITEHPLLWMLDHPDSEGYFSRTDLIALMSAYCDVVGVGYCKLDPPGNRVPPTYCWPLQAQYVIDVKLPSDPRIAYYRYFDQQYDPDEILRFRSPSLGLRDPYGRGYSATFAALQYATLEDKYVAIQDELLAGPMPKLLVSPKDATMPFGEAERKRYEQDLMRAHARGNAGKPLVTSGAAEVTPLTYPPTDLAGMELSRYDLERTCNVFGIPIAYFSTETNLANLQAAESQHARTAIEPRCKSIAGTLTRLAQRYDPRLFFAFDPAVEEDMERAAKVMQIKVQTGVMTINEARIDTPYEPLDGCDEPFISGTLKTPSMIEQAHEQDILNSESSRENEKTATDFQYSDPPDDQNVAERGITRTKDSSGHEHVGKGDPKGGQFTGSGGGGGVATKGQKPRPARKPGDTKESKREKAIPKRGEMAEAKREGKGKDARLVMSDGSVAPAHIKPSMVPPDWTNVRISTDPSSEVLVTARDNKGRSKMVLSPSYEARAATIKFNRVSEMIAKHDEIAKEIQKARENSETKEEAECAWLMQIQATRPGSDRDTKAKAKAYGATTLEARHVVESSDGVRLQFVGKEGVNHDHLIRDPQLAKMLIERKNSAGSPDRKLFNTTDEKVREFTSSLDGGKFSPKDFRTSAATRMAADLVGKEKTIVKDQKELNKRIKAVAEHVSRLLGNRPAQALESYIHPAVFSPWRQLA